MADMLPHVHNCPMVSLQDRVDKIMAGKMARINSLKKNFKPLGRLSKSDLEKELCSRKIYTGDTVKELQGLLNSEMRGIQRLPALLVNNPLASLNALQLQHYEILPVEPLHDVAHHIENLLEELPHHLKQDDKKQLEDTVEMCLGGKNSKRGVDYRAALIKTTSYLASNNLIPQKPLMLL